MTKREVYMSLKQRNDILNKMLKTAAYSKPKRTVDDVISLILKNVRILEIENVRRLMHDSTGIKVRTPALPENSVRNFEDETSTNNSANYLPSKPEKTSAQKTSSGAMTLNLAPGMEIPKSPFLPEKPMDEKEYTLVLDLDETLIHFVDEPNNNHFLTRPGAVEFLEEMNKYYEIVIFTAGMKDYADWVLDQLDVEGTIKHRLYRHHVKLDGFMLIKDLESIGRDLKKTMIVDNLPENFAKQPDNGIFIKTWHNDMTDTCLYDLIPLLRRLVEEQVEDVAVALRKYRDQVIRLIAAGVENPDTELIKVC